ncbi:MAG: phage tail protein [Flavisolibacter sp.]
MATPYIGEIRLFGGNFAPFGWAFCNGQLLSIAENSALFNLIGTTYGGDGQNTFALPDLQGRVPLHMGTGPGLSAFVIGESGGTETETLTVSQIPSHTHVVSAAASGQSDNPAGNVWGGSTGGLPYSASPGTLTMNAGSIQASGGSQPHENMTPFLVVSYIIAIEGVYPSPT